MDDPRFTKPSKTPGEPSTQKEMYDGLTRAYQTIAGELGVRVIPVGDAMYLADTNAKWGYQPDKKFDFKNAVAAARCRTRRIRCTRAGAGPRRRTARSR